MGSRPQLFTIDRSHQFARGLVFAGLGNAAGSSQYYDSSGNNRTGAFTNLIPSTDWVFNRALGRCGVQCNAAAVERVTIPTSPDFSGGATFTVACFCIGSAGAADQYVIGKFYDSTNRSWAIGIDTTYRITFRWSVNGSSGTSSYSSVCLIDGELNHIAVTWSYPGYLTFYCNGVPVGSAETTGAIYKNTCPLFLARFYTILDSLMFTGFIADPVIYNRDLSPAEIFTLSRRDNYMLSGMIRPVGSDSNIYDLEGVR